MGNNVKISIIVPVYNCAKFVKKCLDSLINQTFKDIEIILINDGSTDNSEAIIQSYNDSRIVYIKQKNQGPSAARNLGIDLAKGEYIGFIDSDDWIDTDFYEKLFNAITSNDCDIATASILRERKRHKKYRIKYTEEKVFTTLQNKINACKIPNCCYVWNKLYKTANLKNQKFPEGVYFEDVLWLPNIIKNSDKMVTVPDTNYHYWVNSNSIVKKNSKKKQDDSFVAHKSLIKFFDENSLYLSKKDRSITKNVIEIGNFPILKTKECDNISTTYLFGVCPILKNKRNY